MHEFAGIAFCLVYIILQNFRMWLKYGLKAQKLLAQGIALGNVGKNKVALKGQKLYVLSGVLKLLPLQGDRFASVITQGAALG